MRFLPLIVTVTDVSGANPQITTPSPEPVTVTDNTVDGTKCENQCQDVLATCSTSAEDPGYVCNCQLGYNWNTTASACEDVDECAEGNVACVGAYSCKNLVGSFTCECTEGYEFNTDSNTCVDTDECLKGTSGCDQGCTNTEGSFVCGCTDGYTLGDNGKCDDIDECAADATLCVTAGGSCINTDGGWGCSCAQSGFTWDAATSTCVDIDECAENVCSRASICTNEPGSYKCECPDDYLDKNQDGHVCEYTKYPEYYTWLPTRSAAMYFISAAVDGESVGRYNNMKNAH